MPGKIWRNLWTDPPAFGDRIVAIHDDNSGASIFLCADGGKEADLPNGVILMSTEDGEERDPDGYGLWAALPQDFRCWFEENEGE